MDLMEYAEGGVGAILGAAAAMFGFKSRLNTIEKTHHEFKVETKSMFKEIRSDIKMLIEKSGVRRRDDFQ